MRDRGTGTAAAHEDFDAALREATAVAALSPSSHNCQPWALARLTGDARETAHRYLRLDATRPEDEVEYLVLALDRKRELVALAAHAVEMQVSCGAYRYLLLRALAAHGWTAVGSRTVEEDPPEPGPDWPADWTPLCVTALRRTAVTGEDLPELRELAGRRHTNRAPYRSDPLDPALLAALAEPDGAAEGAVDDAVAGAADDADGVTIRHLTSPQDRQRFVSFLARHAGRDFRDRKAWRETHSYLRFSETEANTRGDGFTLTHLFGPMSRVRHLAMRCLLAPAVMRLLCLVGYHRILAVGLAATVRRSPALVAMCLTGREPGLADALRGGARLARYWLAATRAGLVLHPVSVVLQHDDLRLGVQRELGLPGRTFFLSRLGRPLAGASASPRRTDSAGYRNVGTTVVGPGLTSAHER